MWVLLRPHDSEEPFMQTVTTIGLDIAKPLRVSYRFQHLRAWPEEA
jgi:hypothetical protein